MNTKKRIDQEKRKNLHHLMRNKPVAFTVTENQAGAFLLDLIVELLGLSRKKAQLLLDDRRVTVNGRLVWMKKHRLSAGDRIEIFGTLPKTPRLSPQIPVLWRDAHFLVVDKPPTLVTNDAPNSLEERLRRQEKLARLCAVHRLDRETSGCLIFAHTPADRDALIPLFRNHQITKVYRAIVLGRFADNHRKLHGVLDGKTAVTHVRLLDTSGKCSYLELLIETGRTHQIRRQLATIRCPVLGDRRYAGADSFSLRQPRQMLHAYRLAFPHPYTGKTVRVEAPLPPDFRRCLAETGLG